MLRKVFLISMLLFATSSAFAAPRFRLVTENFPPYNFSKDGKPFEHDASNITGICTEIVQEMFARSEYPYSMKLRGWKHAYNYTLRKSNRAVFGTSRIEEREALFKWVGPLIQNDWVLFARSNFKDKIKTEEDLKKYKIGAYKGDVRAQYLKSKGFNISELSNDHLNPKRLQDGLIDLWVSGGYSGPYYAKEAGVKDIKAVYTLKKVPLYLAVNVNTDDEYVQGLQSILEKMHSEGFVDQVLNKYK